MNEIGGYFGLEQLVSNEYYNNLITLNNGRNSLLYILRAKKINKLYIPYYLCSSVRDMLLKNGYDFEYYTVDAQFMPVFNKTLAVDEYLYIVNYYGQLSNEKILGFKRDSGQIIMDYTHAFFQKPINGIDTIYSCRKFFGVPDGAYLSTDIKLEGKLEIDVSKDRMTHLLGRYEGIASNYHHYFHSNDESFRNEPLKYMSKLTHNILGAIDYERVRGSRNQNYSYLKSELGGINKLRLNTPDGALAYPFYVRNGMDIRKKLAQKKLYIPTFWPNVIENSSVESVEYKYAVNILPLPCDQRYGIVSMEHLVEEIRKCIN